MTLRQSKWLLAGLWLAIGSFAPRAKAVVHLRLRLQRQRTRVLLLTVISKPVTYQLGSTAEIPRLPVSSGNPHSGTFALVAGPGTSDGFIDQVIPTVAGTAI